MTFSIILWIVSIIILLASHIVRTTRQVDLLRSQKAVEKRFDLLVGLSLGYAYNTFLPLRIGELIRAFYISSRSKIQFSIVAGSVIAERVSDLIFVSFLLFVMHYYTDVATANILLKTSIVFILIATISVIFAIIIYKSKSVRRIIWNISNIFNESIAIELVNITWTASELIRCQLLKGKYLLSTISMWSGYIISYWLFAKSQNYSTFGVIKDLISTPMSALAHGFGSETTKAYLVFTFTPVLLILIYGLIRERTWISKIVKFGAPRIYYEKNTLFGSYREFSDYGLFLKSHFSAIRPLVADFSLYGLQNEVIQRILPGGSDALTAIIEVDSRFCIRKFASGDAADKLEVQSKWLKDNKSTLPLCDVINENKGNQKYTFDMPYFPSAQDFYEFIHTATMDECSKKLIEISNSVYDFHSKYRKPENSQEIIDDYLEQKAIKNAHKIIDFVKSHISEEYSINGVKYKLSSWNKLLDINWLRRQINYKFSSNTHGDLTIENIIISPKTHNGWYIIDPNPENIFNSELIDWAKLMQSLHLGYEWLNRSNSSNQQGSDLKLILSRSEAYGALYNDLLQFLDSKFDKKFIKEIFFHEIINYLRLIPYKIRHTPEKAITFFTAASVLLNDYENMSDE